MMSGWRRVAAVGTMVLGLLTMVPISVFAVGITWEIGLQIPPNPDQPCPGCSGSTSEFSASSDGVLSRDDGPDGGASASGSINVLSGPASREPQVGVFSSAISSGGRTQNPNDRFEYNNRALSSVFVGYTDLVGFNAPGPVGSIVDYNFFYSLHVFSTLSTSPEGDPCVGASANVLARYLIAGVGEDTISLGPCDPVADSVRSFSGQAVAGSFYPVQIFMQADTSAVSDQIIAHDSTPASFTSYAASIDARHTASAWFQILTPGATLTSASGSPYLAPVAAVPAPSTLALVLIGAGTCLLWWRRMQRRGVGNRRRRA